MAKWSDTAGQKLRAEFKNTCKEQNLPCWLCQQPIKYDAPAGNPDAFEADHFYPKADYPDLALEPSNLRPAHASCNHSRGKKDAPLPLGRRSANW